MNEDASQQSDVPGQEPTLRTTAYYQQLAAKLVEGRISEEERRELEAWYEQGFLEGLELELPVSVALNEAEHKEKLLKGIKRKLQDDQLHNKKSGHFGWSGMRLWLAAAAVFLIIFGALWYLRFESTRATPAVVASALPNRAVPGHKGAILRLPDGEKVVLDSLQDGIVYQQGEVKILKENGVLKYLGNTDQPVYNDVVTDKGRQWQMYLPDGTQVWLNAGSSLHFPVSFKGQKERIVTLAGEAYFKVVHDQAQPFKVLAGNQVIEDIGTSFNVNAYEDEPRVTTTLVEGALSVNQVMLSPGWQASTAGTGPSADAAQVKTYQVNTDEVTAWMTGQLSLNNVSVEEVLRQLSRWYNVDIIYQGPAPHIRLGGLMDKNARLSDIVTSLNDFGVPVQLKNNALIVSPP